MAGQTNPAPRGTRALTSAIMNALEGIPETNRKAAFRHASAAVKDKLIAQAEKAKIAARRAPARPGAKKAAAVAATRRAAAADREAASKRAPRKRRAGLSEPAASAAPDLDTDVAASVR